MLPHRPLPIGGKDGVDGTPPPPPEAAMVCWWCWLPWGEEEVSGDCVLASGDVCICPHRPLPIGGKDGVDGTPPPPPEAAMVC